MPLLDSHNEFKMLKQAIIKHDVSTVRSCLSSTIMKRTRTMTVNQVKLLSSPKIDKLLLLGITEANKHSKYDILKVLLTSFTDPSDKSPTPVFQYQLQFTTIKVLEDHLGKLLTTLKNVTAIGDVELLRLIPIPDILKGSFRFTNEKGEVSTYSNFLFMLFSSNHYRDVHGNFVISLEAVQYLIKHGGMNCKPNNLGKKHPTLLQRAILYGAPVRILKYLKGQYTHNELKSMLSDEIKVGTNGQTLIERAILNGMPDKIIRFILSLEANLFVEDKEVKIIRETYESLLNYCKSTTILKRRTKLQEYLQNAQKDNFNEYLQAEKGSQLFQTFVRSPSSSELSPPQPGTSDNPDFDTVDPTTSLLKPNSTPS